jgi:membrane-associated phospholipid phosphatase
MNPNQKRESKLNSFFSEIYISLIPIFKSWFFYLGLISVIAGIELNFAMQTYLFDHMDGGKALPMLSDLILDNIPYYEISILYDLFSFIPLIVVLVYFVHKKDYNRIPFFLILFGIIEIVRGVFIVLTPLGNPPMFNGTNSLFNGFSKYELGVYPSGHVGDVFLFLLLVNDRWYKWIMFFCLMVVIISLFFSHGHYSIDILSGLFFAYAINAFGNKYLKMFDLGN